MIYIKMLFLRLFDIIDKFINEFICDGYKDEDGFHRDE